ncbi:Chitin synthase, class 3, partial [Linderina macrospora]
LIGLTSRKLVYIGWMLIYLVSLPIWNFVLPTYAYWHFDDFSWGQTRMVQGEGKDTGHGSGDGEFDSSQIVMKRWCDFEADKRRKTQMILGSVPSLAALAMTNSSDPSVNARGSRVISMRPSSVMSPQITTTSTNQTADSSEQLISTVGPAAQLQQAASQIADSEAQAAAGSIERLGYMTPNIIPVLASQGMSARNSTSQLPTSPGIYSNQYNMSRNASFSPENNAQFYAGSSGNTSSVHFAQGAMPQGPGSNVSSNHDESSTSLPSVKKQ